MTIEIHNLTRRFGDFTAVDDVSMRVEEGSLTALLGPSGSGKTTVLRMIAGLEIPDAGRITVGDRDVTDLRAQDRNIGFVFQQYALFKHMRVADNIAFPLKVRKWKKAAIRERVAELLALLHLDGLEKRYPNQISGGQRQRVALARALASRPQVLLLDEPFSALDARVRDELREWLRSLHDQLHVTSVFVTHDQGEAMELAERIVVMNQGRVAQEGSPHQIVREPNSPFVMNFLGRVNALRGEAAHGEATLAGVRVPYPEANGVRVPVVGYIRPRSIALSAAADADAFPVLIDRIVSSGDVARVYLRTEPGDHPLMAEVDQDTFDALGLTLDSRAYARAREVRVFAEEA